MAVRVEQHAEPIPGYRLLDRIGGGGFGEVWRALAPGGLHKAIKFVYGDLSNAGDQRAEQELKSLKRVQSVRHPYILSLERYDIIDGQLMIVMELADRNLWDRFKECRTQGLPGIPREELLSYLEETAEALDLMNREYQLQHLDIKPQNIFLVHNHVKVADFGLVKDMEGSHATITGGITPVYAAPETFEGNLTRYSDQYSLAIVFQELLTGQRPFNGTNVRQLILQHLQGVPNVSSLPAADQPHIFRALAKMPTERFATCGDLIAALREAGRARLGSDQGTTHRPSEPPAAPGAGSALVRALQDQAVSTHSPGTNGSAATCNSIPLTTNLRALVADTGSHQGTTHCLRAVDPVVLKAPDENAFRAPPEIKGPGSLFPAIVIGLGQMGLTVLQRLRENLHASVSFAPGTRGPDNQWQANLSALSQLPHLRFLLIDTDPEVIRTATRGHPSTSLTAGDVVLAPLNRPSYYLKARDGRPNLESWLNPKLLYRIPRSQVTTGVRALGRLAFCDNYRSIVRRLQLELETALDPASLTNAARHTGLGIRGNRPRIYIIAGLAGGTGSGMFLDVAYTARALLRQMGYEAPDVVGLLLLPPVDSSRTRVLPLGNTYAALTELNHFAAAHTVFRARYHDREAAIEDDSPPFSRSILLPMPDESDEVGTQEVVDLCGQMLYRDLFTPLGKTADLGRAGLTAPPWESRGQYFGTFGLYQLSWPRLAMMELAGQRLCQRLVQRWMSKDSKPLREVAHTWVQEQWALHELGADAFIQRLQTGVVQRLGKTPEAIFAALIDPLARVSGQGDSSQGRGRREPRALDPKTVAEVLDSLESLLGRSIGEGISECARALDDRAQDQGGEDGPSLPSVLREVTDQLGNEWSQKLAELSVHLIEAPAFRLAGAEEAIRQASATVEQVLQHHEPLARDLARKASEAADRLRAWCQAAKSGQRKPALSVAEIVELLRGYAKSRYQAQILQHLGSAFVSLRGHLSDELREVNFCRVRLTELARMLEETPCGEQRPVGGEPKGGIGRLLFVSGCKDVREAVDLYLEGITPEHLLDLDGHLEEMVKANFTALVHVCLTNANILKQVEEAMRQTARDYVAEHLPAISIAKLFFEQHPNADEAETEVRDCYDQAAPELSPGRTARGDTPVAELCILAAPADADSDAFRQLAEKALEQTEILAAEGGEDILVYRERNNLALAELEHLGAVGHDAYAQMTTAENFTPHSRCDIDFLKHRAS
jgi:serine/threonine protein kinase